MGDTAVEQVCLEMERSGTAGWPADKPVTCPLFVLPHQVRARQGRPGKRRVALAAGTGLVLLALVAVAFSGGHASLGGALAEKGQDAATASAPAAKAATTSLAARDLTAEKERVRAEIKSIDKQIETEQARAPARPAPLCSSATPRPTVRPPSPSKQRASLFTDVETWFRV